MKEVRDITGMRFGRLVADRLSHFSRHKKAVWLCHCDCGESCEVLSASLLSGRTVSCRCFQKERMAERPVTHGKSKTREYRIWAGMMDRGKGTSHPTEYYDRGIRVCERWHRFENFFEDMGRAPSKTHSIDRIDNDGDYHPANCKWSTKGEQARNKRNNRVIEFRGEKRCQAEWVRLLGVTRSRIEYALKKGRDLSGLVEA